MCPKCTRAWAAASFAVEKGIATESEAVSATHAAAATRQRPARSLQHSAAPDQHGQHGCNVKGRKAAGCPTSSPVPQRLERSRRTQQRNTKEVWTALGAAGAASEQPDKPPQHISPLKLCNLAPPGGIRCLGRLVQGQVAEGCK